MLQMAHHDVGLTVDFTARTEPSIIPQLTTPGWRLPAVIASSSLSELTEEKSQLKPFGVMTPVNRFWPDRPHHQQAPNGNPPVLALAVRGTPTLQLL
jgi:hypothetical protein